MKVVILLCVAVLALALADDAYPGYDDVSYIPRPYPIPVPYPYPRPYYPRNRVYYNYNVRYPYYYGASQGKEEAITPRGTRGSYYVDEPYSSQYVSYNYAH